MASPFLLEVRTGGEVKRSLRRIIHDVADEFGVQGAVQPRAVPHISLFGPYNTNNGYRVKDTVSDVLDEFELVPYRIDGFGRFTDSKVIFANVVPSHELQRLRRELSRRLRPITYNYQPYDEDCFYDFHITIAYRDAGRQFDDIWQYVNTEYKPVFDEYATRITSLRRRKMMWEFDLLQQEVMSQSAATTAKSWERTMERLDHLSSPQDHAQLASRPGTLGRYCAFLMAKLRRQW